MKFSLQTQILTALSVFALLFVGALALNSHHFNVGLEYQKNLALTQTLSLRSSGLAERAETYGEVAPREFSAYERDLKLFYPNLKKELENLANSVESLDAITTKSEEVSALKQKHSQFIKGLWEQIGDVDEPRLEWGARYLAEQAPILRDATKALEMQMTEIAKTNFDNAKRINTLSWIFGAISILLILTWFWRRVTRRISQAADSCKQVAEGDFGTTIKDDSNDEIGQFSGAFNSLSSRTRVVLGVLDKLPAHATPSQAFNTLWSESNEFLGHKWQAMFNLDNGFDKVKLVALQQNLENEFPSKALEFPIERIAKTIKLEEKGHAVWEDIRRHTLQPADAKLLRELTLRKLQTLVLVVLKDKEQRPTRLLAFAWSENSAENVGVSGFLGGLSRFFSKLLTDDKK